MSRGEVVSGTINLVIPSQYAAIYARVSTEDQGKGFSIPTQIEACQKLAHHNGYTAIESHPSKSCGLGSS